MQTYLERYLNGDRTGVWAELVGLGPAVRSEPVYSDARAVAQAIMGRARTNIEHIFTRLGELDYRFIDPENAWKPPDASLLRALDQVEGRCGPLPLVLRAWYEEVGEVDFMGAHPRLSRCDGHDWGGSESLRVYSDPIMVGWFSRMRTGLLSFYLNQAEDWEEMERMETENPPPYGIDMGLSAINKANHSGSGAVQMMVPCPAFDAPLIDWDHNWIGTFLTTYLRTCFEWGGFPGLRGLPEGERPVAELEYLKRDLLPL